MKTTKKMKLFVQQFVAVVKGDDATALGIKPLREADATLTAQIAVLTGRNVQFENAIELAEEALNNAMVNGGKSIGGQGDSYITMLFSLKNELTDAKDALEVNQERIKFLQEVLTKLNSEVDEA